MLRTHTCSELKKENIGEEVKLSWWVSNDEHHAESNEEIRYKHRYIDLRRKKVLDNVKFRSKFLHFTRNWFTEKDFLDVQTPIFTASSPEWARDFVIPSRLNPGKFYALPQAPQQYKQLLMVGWIDKYFQVAPCFRDEDPRADRHSCEFYQIDCEMSFVEQSDVFSVVENFLTDCVWALSDKTIMDSKFYSMTFEEAMETYGSDKPDLRYEMKLVDVASIFARSTNWIFSGIWEDSVKNRIKAIKVTRGDELFSKTQMKNFEKYVRQFGAQGLWYFQMKEDWLKGPLNRKVDFGHNPFSMPKGWIKAFEEEDLLKVSSVQYDLACNWFEILSGSIRNHDVKALVAAFEKVGRTEEEVKDKFGAMYEAFQYGVPPHGWFGLWMDRFMMILKDEENIREIYAFPKSGKAQDLMMNAPAFIDDQQLKELSIEVIEEDED